MKTVGDIINYVDRVVPNNVGSSDKYVYLQDICRDVRHLNTKYDTWDTNTITSASFYNLPTNINWTDLLWVGVSNSTYDVAISPSTMPYSDYQEYKYKGLDESITGLQWIESGDTGITLYGLSTQNKHWIRYKCLPHLVFCTTSSSDSTSYLNVDDILTDYIQNKLAAKVCKSGAFPRVDLANNYELEANELLSRIKLNKKQFETRTAKRKISYKGWW